MDEEPDDAEVQRRYQQELGLVDTIAGQVSRRVGTAVALDDLLSAGREGLFDAARRYDARRAVPFRAYASLRVRGAMIDGVRQQAQLSRRAHERLAALRGAIEQSQGELNWASPRSRYNSALDTESRLATHLANMATAAVVGSMGPCDVLDLEGSINESQNPEQQLEDAELLQLVRKTIDEMTSDEAGVVRAFYFEEKSISEIAAQYNISSSWASRLHTRAMDRLTRRVRASV